MSCLSLVLYTMIEDSFTNEAGAFDNGTTDSLSRSDLHEEDVPQEAQDLEPSNETLGSA